jgi:hypothetical protein
VILNIAGIHIEVVKKKIKNMHLYVKPPDGHVSVSAPETMSDAAIERFVRTKLSWIKRQTQSFDQQPRQSKREYVSGETLYLWGKQYFLLVEYGNKNDVDLRGDSVILTVRKGSAANQRGNVINEWYRKRLKEEITKILPKWEEKTGITATEWKVRYMTSRWGSCNVETGTIWLNLQLAKKTPECLEYIILHELVHLVEKNHNEAFLSLLDLHMPMWREIKAKLNSQTLDFME